jgi:biopolymer transport protein TolR
MAMLIRNSGGRGKRRKPMADINVTPMVDVMLVLLVVFMVTAPMLATGVTVTLPKTRADQMKTEKERPLVVTVDKAGKVYVGLEDTPVELKDLAPMLKALAENNLEKRVYVRADEAVNYGAVVTVLALLQSSGFTNAGLPVDPNSAKRILQEK